MGSGNLDHPHSRPRTDFFSAKSPIFKNLSLLRDWWRSQIGIAREKKTVLIVNWIMIYDLQPEHGFRLWKFQTLSLDHFELWTLRHREAVAKEFPEAAVGSGSLSALQTALPLIADKWASFEAAAVAGECPSCGGEAPDQARSGRCVGFLLGSTLQIRRVECWEQTQHQAQLWGLGLHGSEASMSSEWPGRSPASGQLVLVMG